MLTKTEGNSNVFKWTCWKWFSSILWAELDACAKIEDETTDDGFH